MAQHPVCGKKVFYRDICRSCVNKHKEEAENYGADISGSPHEYMLRAAKARAKTEGVPFELEPKDICITEKCPVLGIQMKFHVEHSRDDSASLDRIVPDLGYVRGNVAVISMKANRMKQDNTLESLECVVNYIRNGIRSKPENVGTLVYDIESLERNSEDYKSDMKEIAAELLNNDALIERLSKTADPTFNANTWNAKTKWMDSFSPNEMKKLMAGVHNCIAKAKRDLGNDVIDGDGFDYIMEHVGKRVLRMRS